VILFPSYYGLFSALFGLDSRPDECHDFVDFGDLPCVLGVYCSGKGLFGVVLADYCLDVVCV
jgi:hypothetical protein